MSPSPTASAILSRFYAACEFAQIPDRTVHAGRRHLLDTLGAALAGASAPEPTATLAAGRLTHGMDGPAILLARAETAPPALAALVNGTAAHALELDDSTGCDHSGAVVVPALLAALPLAPRGVTGGDLIAALLIGYDLGRRVLEAAGGYDPHNDAGWHSTGTCGVFGAAAAVSRLMRLPAETTRHALGIAGSFASGNWSFLPEGAMTKRLHPAHAASAGVVACAMAREGFTGPSGVFDEPWGGYLHTYARGTATPEALTRGLGEDWRIHVASIKPFASCRGTHAGAEAALALRGLVPAEAVESVEIGVNAVGVRMCGANEVASLLEAQMSLPYAVTVAWLHGNASLPAYRPEVLNAPETAAWMRKVRVVEDAWAETSVAARVTVRRQGGGAEELRIASPVGSHDRPLPDEELRAKYRGLASPVIGAERAAALESLVMSLGPQTDPAALIPLLTA